MREGLILSYLAEVLSDSILIFLGEVTERPKLHADSISVWVNQWPLKEEKFQTPQWLVQEQVGSSHIPPSNSSIL